MIGFSFCFVAFQGTVYPSQHFDAEALCNRLRKAMKGLGTDEKTIIEVIGSVDNRQRQQLKTTYKGMFGKVSCYFISIITSLSFYSALYTRII
jgi:hypothetical protein